MLLKQLQPLTLLEYGLKQASAEDEEVIEEHITGVVICAAMGDPEPLSLVLVLA
jgi:hypothetical protein